MKPQRIENRKLLNAYHLIPCEVCEFRPSDPAHIRSRGAGGDDVVDNLIALCRTHHAIQHQYGWKRFVDLFPRVESVLSEKGWVFLGFRLVRKEQHLEGA